MALTQVQTGSGNDLSSYSASTPYNYRDVFGFDNQPDSTNLPQIYEREVTIYGNRTLMGFLRMIGSEMPTNSQQIRWAEQRRLHVFYNSARVTTTSVTGGVQVAIYANDSQTSGSAVALGTSNVNIERNHSLRVGDKVLVAGSATDTTAVLGYVSAVAGKNGSGSTVATANIISYGGSIASVGGTNENIHVLVIGTEFGKGSDSRSEVLQPEYDSYVNNTVIQRDTFAVNGTDANQVGWVEIADENGVQGKYWYLKGKSETMTRWEDYQETALLEDRRNATPDLKSRGRAAGTTSDQLQRNGVSNAGSEGFFEAVENRGNTTTGGIGTGATTFLNDIDLLLTQFDKEGNIEENVMYLNREESLNFDDGMAQQNNGTGGTSSSWGLFNNSEKMGLSLGFQSVRRGSYDFYKKDWKYLNQVDGRGSFGGIRGVTVPMGSKSVYDQYGANLSAPFASIHYLAGPMGSRKNQSWVHGGQAPTPTSGLDSMNVEFLSEKCICLKGANNFFLFT